MRAFLTVVALVLMTQRASAQPVDPYQQPSPPSNAAPPAAPAPAPAAPAAPAPSTTPAAPPASTRVPAGSPDAPQDPYAGPPVASAGDPMMAERVARALVNRAQELLDARSFLDAKQLAVEALVGSPKGGSAEQARAIIHAVNQQLGIPEDAPRPEARPEEDVDTTPIQDPTLSTAPVVAPPEGGLPSGRLAARVHGGLYAGVLGATVGAFLSSTPAAGAVPLGIAAGAAGVLAVPRLVDKLGWSESEVRTVGAATVWGGMVGGLFGDIAKTQGTSAREVLVAASLGSTLGGLGGYALTRARKLTRGDVALIDTFAGIGAVGGLTLGMVMQPAETEAYSLNSVVGITAGVVVGAIAAPQTSTTPRRMVRVAGFAAIGGAVPFLLYAAVQSSKSTVDERVTGLLSTGGLLAGAYLGFRLTRGMDDGLDTLDGKPSHDGAGDAPVALVGRGSDGRWGLGGVGLTPLSPALAPQRGMALQLVGAAF